MKNLQKRSPRKNENQEKKYEGFFYKLNVKDNIDLIPLMKRSMQMKTMNQLKKEKPLCKTNIFSIYM